MTWEIALGIFTLVGFLITIATLVAKLVAAMTKLTITVSELSQKFGEAEEQKRESHKRIWEHESEQDKWLRNHEDRLHDLDGKRFKEV